MRIKISPLILLFILPFFNSCINNADFDQINLGAEPIFEAPLVYFELNQLDFLDDTGTVEIQTITDITDLEILQSSVIQEDLIRVLFRFEVENTFDRVFIAELDLLNGNNDVVYSFNDLDIFPSNNVFTQSENIVIADHPQVLNARRVRIRITLAPASVTLDPDQNERLEFRSTGTFYLRL